MAPIIHTVDPRATRILDAAGIKYTLGAKTTQTSTAIGGDENSDVWTIEGVNYRGKVIPVTLSKRLLPRMNLKGMITYAQEAIRTEKPHSAALLLFMLLPKE